jgi:class 3 adenylate cyclase
MAQLNSSVIVKTDLSGFARRVAAVSEPDLNGLLAAHRQLIEEGVERHAGSIVKGDGASYWLTFPSVSAAALAAMEMRDALWAGQSGKAEDGRLAMRAAITLGDVLQQDRDLFGDAVNLAARIESVTPADEIYLSQAAWLALNKAEVQTAYAGEFALKGIVEPVKVYRIEQQHRTRVLRNQVIVFSDLRGFAAFVATRSLPDVEALLLTLDNMHKEVCEKYDGTVRMIVGDAYHLTFDDARAAMAAVDRLQSRWREYCVRIKAACTIGVGVHKGDMYLFRAFLYGVDINVAVALQALARKVAPGTHCVLVSGKVHRDLEGSDWVRRLRRVEIEPDTRRETDEAYQLV